MSNRIKTKSKFKLKPLTDSLILVLSVRLGVSVSDLEKIRNDGFGYCEKRGSFIKFE